MTARTSTTARTRTARTAAHAKTKSKPKNNTSLSLGERQEAFIREQVDGGEYATASEVVRDALRRMELEKRKEEAFYAAIDRGMNSPRAAPDALDRLWKKHGIDR